LITISLNGERREVPENLMLDGLLEWLSLPPDRIAVEVNLQIARRTTWAETPIREGDRLEVVHFVGGGSARRETNPVVDSSSI
jgi:thiamine biosynthesis protein ThiS